MKSCILALSAILLLMPSVQAHAAKLKMVCESPRREYLLTYDETTKTMYADKTLYRVLAVEKTQKKLVVVGLTVNDGPTFRAHFLPYKKIEFFSDNQLIQTDGCRSTK
ncbi:MAG: hypothetical protein LBE54_11755 [Brucellaceae bacterium]|jgi:hypothetical protein|nr:hypothetical protein [Brucellaceae bacterium]